MLRLLEWRLEEEGLIFESLGIFEGLAGIESQQQRQGVLVGMALWVEAHERETYSCRGIGHGNVVGVGRGDAIDGPWVDI